MGRKGLRRQRWKMLCRFLSNERKRGNYIAIEKWGALHIVRVAQFPTWVELMWSAQLQKKAEQLMGSG
jgi:hypothetical protein